MQFALLVFNLKLDAQTVVHVCAKHRLCKLYKLWAYWPFPAKGLSLTTCKGIRAHKTKLKRNLLHRLLTNGVNLLPVLHLFGKWFGPCDKVAQMQRLAQSFSVYRHRWAHIGPGRLLQVEDLNPQMLYQTLFLEFLATEKRPSPPCWQITSKMTVMRGLTINVHVFVNGKYTSQKSKELYSNNWTQVMAKHAQRHNLLRSDLPWQAD